MSQWAVDFPPEPTSRSSSTWLQSASSLLEAWGLTWSRTTSLTEARGGRGIGLGRRPPLRAAGPAKAREYWVYGTSVIEGPLGRGHWRVRRSSGRKKPGIR